MLIFSGESSHVFPVTYMKIEQPLLRNRLLIRILMERENPSTNLLSNVNKIFFLKNGHSNYMIILTEKYDELYLFFFPCIMIKIRSDEL